MAPVTELPRTPQRKAGDPLRVLIVDDDREVARSLGDVVEELGDIGDITHSGHEAIRLALDTEPDVLLLDLSLPDTSGLRIAETVRASSRAKKPKIIAVTGSNDPDAKRQTAAAGFDLHLTKPIRLGVLESMLELLRSAPVHG